MFRRTAVLSEKTIVNRSNDNLFSVKVEPMHMGSTEEVKHISIDISEYCDLNDQTETYSCDAGISKMEITNETADSFVEFVSELQDTPETTIQFIYNPKKSIKKLRNAKIARTNRITRQQTSCKKKNQPTVITGDEEKCGKKKEPQQKHTTLKEKIECEYCHKILTSRLSLRNHKKIHSGFDVVCEVS